MKLYLECFSCILDQTLRVARLASRDPAIHEKIMKEVSLILNEADLGENPPVLGGRVYKVVSDISGRSDPYKEVKDRYNSLCLGLYPELKKMVSTSFDPLRTAIKAAIAGNMIDFGTGKKFDLKKDIRALIKRPLRRSDYPRFRSEYKKAREILYIGDNTGEVVFDRILIEELIKKKGTRVTYAVREEPVINDATMEDAIAVGMDKIAKVISSGMKIPGTLPGEAKREFRSVFNHADMVISKGQGNFETLDDCERDIFFLFQTKCIQVTKYLRCGLGDTLLYFKLGN